MPVGILPYILTKNVYRDWDATQNGGGAESDSSMLIGQLKLSAWIVLPGLAANFLAILPICIERVFHIGLASSDSSLGHFYELIMVPLNWVEHLSGSDQNWTFYTPGVTEATHSTSNWLSWLLIACRLIWSFSVIFMIGGCMGKIAQAFFSVRRGAPSR